jgi:diaminohydroxyphosphoribosylaminopyrimidine deaminase/5-amino-6-(5-phosphoribosylamino)uracil reductase
MIDDGSRMSQALKLAEHGRGAVEPNPLVGALIVRDGQILGAGYHQRFGGPHAEILALASAEADVRGATLFVTLEPCCHFGKTPPCTDALVQAGIARVVVAQADPFPEVAGKGIALLRKAGLTVEVGLGEREARRLNAPYLKLLSTELPYVHAKWAMSLDGKLATRGGDSRWISGEESRRQVHALRGRMDAIVVGIGTALADDPLLTARPAGPRIALRIVLDSTGRLPLESRLVRTAREAPFLLATSGHLPVERRQAFEQHGCEVLALAAQDGRLSVLALLQHLGRQRRTNVLVEGGGEVLGSFHDAGLIDEVHAFIAPAILGGKGAVVPFEGLGVQRVAEAWRLSDCQVSMTGKDIYVHGWRGRGRGES